MAERRSLSLLNPGGIVRTEYETVPRLYPEVSEHIGVPEHERRSWEWPDNPPAFPRRETRELITPTTEGELFVAMPCEQGLLLTPATNPLDAALHAQSLQRLGPLISEGQLPPFLEHITDKNPILLTTPEGGVVERNGQLYYLSPHEALPQLFLALPLPPCSLPGDVAIVAPPAEPARDSLGESSNTLTVEDVSVQRTEQEPGDPLLLTPCEAHYLLLPSTLTPQGYDLYFATGELPNEVEVQQLLERYAAADMDLQELHDALQVLGLESLYASLERDGATSEAIAEHLHVVEELRASGAARNEFQPQGTTEGWEHAYSLSGAMSVTLVTSPIELLPVPMADDEDADSNTSDSGSLAVAFPTSLPPALRGPLTSTIDLDDWFRSLFTTETDSTEPDGVTSRWQFTPRFPNEPLSPKASPKQTDPLQTVSETALDLATASGNREDAGSINPPQRVPLPPFQVEYQVAIRPPHVPATTSPRDQMVLFGEPDHLLTSVASTTERDVEQDTTRQIPDLEPHTPVQNIPSSPHATATPSLQPHKPEPAPRTPPLQPSKRRPKPQPSLPPKHQPLPTSRSQEATQERTVTVPHGTNTATQATNLHEHTTTTNTSIAQEQVVSEETRVAKRTVVHAPRAHRQRAESLSRAERSAEQGRKQTQTTQRNRLQQAAAPATHRQAAAPTSRAAPHRTPTRRSTQRTAHNAQAIQLPAGQHDTARNVIERAIARVSQSQQALPIVGESPIATHQIFPVSNVVRRVARLNIPVTFQLTDGELVIAFVGDPLEHHSQLARLAALIPGSSQLPLRIPLS